MILPLCSIEFFIDSGSMLGMQTDQYVAGNKSETTQASGNSTSRLFSNDLTELPRTGNTEEQWQYRAEWSDFNACGSTASQDQRTGFTSMHNPEYYNWGAFDVEKEDRWRYLSNDWNTFNAAFDGYSLASNI
jgi:hypothetical protein